MFRKPFVTGRQTKRAVAETAEQAQLLTEALEGFMGMSFYARWGWMILGQWFLKGYHRRRIDRLHAQGKVVAAAGRVIN